LGPALLDRGMVYPKAFPSRRVTVPNLVTLGQTIWPYVGVQKLGAIEVLPLGVRVYV